jgi:hypothetical protein
MKKRIIMASEVGIGHTIEVDCSNRISGRMTVHFIDRLKDNTIIFTDNFGYYWNVHKDTEITILNRS